MSVARKENTVLAEEDILRAGFYRLLARLFARPVDEETLATLAGLEGDDTDLGTSLENLAEAARATTVAEAEQEYNDLFIGMTRGELVPYGSYYITGFLNEKPLAALRGDMAALRIAKADDVSEPEDHMASLCEMMAGLIAGDFGEPLCLGGQKEFFDKHLAPWAGRFFTDLEAARAASFYRPAGTVGRLFMAIETEAFSMAG